MRDIGLERTTTTKNHYTYNASRLGVPPGSVDCGKELSFLEFMFTGTVRAIRLRLHVLLVMTSYTTHSLGATRNHSTIWFGATNLQRSMPSFQID